MKKTLILFSFLLIFAFFILYFVLFPIKYEQEIVNFSNKYNIKPELTCSVICAESSFNKYATSSKGAVGLMQLIPSTAKWIYCNIYENEFSVELLQDEKINIELGCYYLNYLQNKFDSIIYVLCAYNAGETTVRNWIMEFNQNGQTLNENNIPYQETKKYVRNVLNYLKVYSLKLKQ